MPTPHQVLILAPEHDARLAAAIARSLRFEPVLACSPEAALRTLEMHSFHAVAVSGNGEWQGVREAARLLRPQPRLFELPPGGGDSALRRVLLRHLDPALTADRPPFSLERYRMLSTILEAFMGTLDTREIVRRIVSITRSEFSADRAWLLQPVGEEVETAKVWMASASTAGKAPATHSEWMVPLGGSRRLIRRAFESPLPITAHQGDSEIDSELASRFGVGSLVVQILRPGDGEPWAFGLDTAAHRQWSGEEVALFGEIGRLATLALNNALIHAQAVADTAKMNAVLDQIPEAAAIYDADGRLERMNAAAARDFSGAFGADPSARFASAQHRYVDGRALTPTELPSVRALEGESVKSDYVIRDPRSGEDRVMNLKAAPIRDAHNRIVGSVLLARDVTEERQNAERETLRRRRAECLANLGVEAIAMQPVFENLDDPARRIAEAITGTAMIYIYERMSGALHMVGMHSAGPTADAVQAFREYLASKPYHPGEGVPGAVFQIGRTLFFSDVRGSAILDFARADDDRAIVQEMHEEALVACPIEAYGERIGALVIARNDDRRAFDAEDLEFAQTIADRIGAAAHIHRLTRISQEGHRAAEELARREVDARVRLEAVLDNAPIGIAVISADELRFELTNARFLEFTEQFGKVPIDAKVVGLHVADVFPGFERVLKAVAESGETRLDEAWEIGPRSNPRYITRIISAVRGRFSGITQSLTVLIQDVTEQVKAKRQIEALADMMAERSARLDSILSSMTDGLWVYDAAGAVVDVNQSALTMFGLGSRTEAVERASYNRFDLRYPDGRPVPSRELPQARALRGETVPDYLAIGKHVISGKDLDLSIAAAPIESGGVVGAVLVMRDITALQELDRKKDEFLSVASHELRTPLTTIKGYTQLLAQTVNELPPDERQTYLSAVLGEVDRMMGLISELLDVSRIETNRLVIHRQPIGWAEFLERRASAFRVQNPGRAIRFEADIDAALIVKADPDRMRQVIDNLLSNALKYSGESSDIDIFTMVEDDSILTAVVDHGIGIPKDELPQLFERFHRARNVSSRYYSGLGLGLYISKAIVVAHGGAIAVESIEGEGSRFTIRLPLE